MRKIILISGKQRSGKDTLADLLLAQLPGFTKAPLALELKKEYWSHLFRFSGHKFNLEVMDEMKNCYPKIRKGLIDLGAMRRAEDTAHWVKLALEVPGDLIIPDWRYKSEALFIASFAENEVIKIRMEASREVREQRGTLSNEDDPSECDLDDYNGFDWIIPNQQDTGKLALNALDLVDHLSASGLQPS